MTIAADGSFEIVLSKREHAGNWLRLEDDAVCAITRDYLASPASQTKARWTIECLDAAAPPPRRTDAAYAMGSFRLQSDQALVIRGRSPECAFWNMCLWNPFLHTYDYAYERVTINAHQVKYESDGSWTIVVA